MCDITNAPQHDRMYIQKVLLLIFVEFIWRISLCRVCIRIPACLCNTPEPRRPIASVTRIHHFLPCSRELSNLCRVGLLTVRLVIVIHKALSDWVLS
jgi:hypothetical protein